MKAKNLVNTLLLAGGLVFGGLAHADNFPSKPLTMVIGWGAGGSTDIQGRVLATVLSEQLGQPVNVVNRPGAGGGVALAQLANSRDGGYTFVFGTSMTVTFGPLSAPATYDLDSFRYAAGVTLGQSAIVTGQNRPFSNWQELIAHAKANPGVSYANQTAFDRFLIDFIARQEGLDLRIVPTSGGAGMAPLILSGDVNFAYSGGTHSGYANTGEMPVLVSLADERLVAFPDAPTLRELGYEIDPGEIRVVMLPKNAPDNHVQRLAEALEAATKDPRFIEITEERILMPVVFLDGDAVYQDLSAKIASYKRIIEEMGGLSN
ncbi:MAG: tripartite tricarboxylate transporter substrate binding protein [Rhodocyclaceae bacterium]